MRPDTLVIRADASVGTGTGHVMRCLALAQAWRRMGGALLFVMAQSTPAVLRRLQEEEIEVASWKCIPGSKEDGDNLVKIADERCATWIAVDGYVFDFAYQRRITDSQHSLLCIDDIGRCAPYCTDFVLNQNVYAHVGMYPGCESSTNLLLGPRYALLREEFLAWRSWEREFPATAKRLLVTMGGSDPHNVTALLVDALRRSDLDIELIIVIGGSNPNAEEFRQLLRESGKGFKLEIDAHDLSGLMAEADMAISSGGSTCYELALLQVPMILIALAENQTPTAKSLAHQSAAINAGWFQDIDLRSFIGMVRALLLDSDVRRLLAKKARQLVDGNGARRVCESMLRSEGSHGATFKVEVGAQ
jgi:UDP-2,4-diacetamido-2,4,6-trideoxy-beta-L-altropyranose hydrolase